MLSYNVFVTFNKIQELVLLISFEVQAGEVLNRIKNTGVVRCGVRTTANAFITKAGDDTVGIDAEVWYNTSNTTRKIH